MNEPAFGGRPIKTDSCSVHFLRLCQKGAIRCRPMRPLMLVFSTQFSS